VCVCEAGIEPACGWFQIIPRAISQDGLPSLPYPSHSVHFPVGVLHPPSSFHFSRVASEGDLKAETILTCNGESCKGECTRHRVGFSEMNITARPFGKVDPSFSLISLVVFIVVCVCVCVKRDGTACGGLS